MELFKKKFDRKVYGWKRKDEKPNVGDELARKIVEEILLFRDVDKNIFSKDFKGKFLSIGSVMHFAKSNDVVWGTGVNGKININLHKFINLDVRAVRGPRTREFLEKRNIFVPEIYGDPALLSPLFFSKKAFINAEEKYDYLIIPHMSEVDSFKEKFPIELICSPLQSPYDFIKKIINAKKIYSSSLHGIILAEAYEIPVVWLKSENGEDEFKYYDYYEGTGRKEAENISEFKGYKCMHFEKIPNLEIIQRNLLKSFPYDLWKIN